MADGVFLHFLKNELAELLVGAKIFKILQPIKDELIFYLKQGKERYQLMVNVSPACFGVYLSKEKPQSTLVPPMFCMLLRKHLGGGEVAEISQEGLDRVLYIKVKNKDQLGESREFCLVVELVSQCPNALLLNEDGVVLGAIKLPKSEKRKIEVNQKYPRLRQTSKVNLLKATPAELDETESLEKLLQGVGKQTGAELRRVYGSNKEAARALGDLLKASQNPKPVIARDEKGTQFPFFELKTEGAYQEFESFSGLLEFFLVEQTRENLIKQRTKGLTEIINTHKTRVKKRLKVQKEELLACEKKEEKKKAADLLNSNLHLIKERASSVVVRDFFEEGQPEYTISLDKNLTALQNMQKYYKEYRKCKTAQAKLTELIAAGERELEYLESLSFSALQAASEAEVEEIRQELMEQGYLRVRARRKKAVKAEPEKIILADGVRLFVGKNNLQNEALTLKIAKKNDIWFHAQKVPGAHVVLKLEPGREPTKEILEAAARLAAENSRARGSAVVAVDYTKISNVKKMPNGKPGMVNYVNFKTIFIRLT